MIIQHLVFYVFSALLVISALGVILARNPVRAALFLVAAFISSALLWMLLEAEFLALVLVIVYVGAVMTLFLFVVMMLNPRTENLRHGFVRYLPFAILVVALLSTVMVIVLGPSHVGALPAVVPHPEGYSNIKALGMVLYTHHVLAFETAAVILLVAIVAAISLAFRGMRPGTKGQRPEWQVSVRREDRVRLVSMPAEKKGGHS